MAIDSVFFQLLGAQLPLQGTRGGLPSLAPWLTSWMWALSFILVLISVFIMVRVGRRILAAWRDLESGGIRFALATALFSGAILRIFCPHRLVQVFHGYTLTQYASELGTIPPYGPGTFALYHLPMRMFGVDHLWLWIINTTVGILTLGVLAFCVYRLFGGGEQTRGGEAVPPGPSPGLIAAVFVWILAIHPMFVKDHVSESILIPTLFWWTLGWACWQSYRIKGRAVDLFACGAMLALAALSRPLWLFGPLFVWGLDRVAVVGKKRVHFNKPVFWVAVVGFAIVLAPLVYHRWLGTAMFPSLLEVGPGEFLARIAHVSARILLFHPEATPIVVPILFILGLWRAPKPLKKLIWTVTGIGLVLFILYSYDQPFPSMPRLQVPSHWMFMIVAAVGGAWLWERARSRLVSHTRIWFGIAAVVAISSVAATYPHHWRVRSYDVEERFFRAHLPGLKTLAPKGGVFVRIGQEDQPRDWVSRAYPEYLLPGDWQVFDLAPFMSEAEKGVGDLWKRPVIYLRSTRCYAQLVDDVQHLKRWAHLKRQPAHPACRAFEDSFQLNPLVGPELNQVGNAENYLHYPEDGLYSLALYRVEPLNSSEFRDSESSRPPVLPPGLEGEISAIFRSVAEQSQGRLQVRGVQISKDQIHFCLVIDEAKQWCSSLIHPTGAIELDCRAGPYFVVRFSGQEITPPPWVLEVLTGAVKSLAGDWWK